ncbi:hypothetical protein GT347_23280 [Xylophilus rhododendri]|uniref:Uncharacterized protein n=1 Tax=Xylophilus rhododendri TaxID=2697032 RepID=A0A857JA90_9BURK|nr:hypothetical protein [Xylophilus rhododendri]QHJ00648.1 hypothetical protein GT347_23280 [Xylophilus rhododendri]
MAAAGCGTARTGPAIPATRLQDLSELSLLQVCSYLADPDVLPFWAAAVSGPADPSPDAYWSGNGMAHVLAAEALGARVALAMQADEAGDAATAAFAGWCRQPVRPGGRRPLLQALRRLRDWRKKILVDRQNGLVPAGGRPPPGWLAPAAVDGQAQALRGLYRECMDFVRQLPRGRRQPLWTELVAIGQVTGSLHHYLHQRFDGSDFAAENTVLALMLNTPGVSLADGALAGLMRNALQMLDGAAFIERAAFMLETVGALRRDRCCDKLGTAATVAQQLLCRADAGLVQAVCELAQRTLEVLDPEIPRLRGTKAELLSSLLRLKPHAQLAQRPLLDQVIASMRA